MSPSSNLMLSPMAGGTTVSVVHRDKYPIHIGERLAEVLPLILTQAREVQGSTRMHVITDPMVAEHYLPTVSAIVTTVGFASTKHVLPQGEDAKSAATLAEIWAQMHRSGVDRRTLILGLGGGTICDVATLAAATYMRGLPYLLVPTTLVAQADAAIGGKGGVDFDGVKNLVGAFYHPAAVVVDPMLLRTLDGQQVRSGMAEIIKVAVISDACLFGWIESSTVDRIRAAGELTRMVQQAIRRKLELLAADPFERNSLARPLNYGHCVGHALEAASGFAIPHGEAVAAGMAVAASVGVATGHCAVVDLHQILSVITRHGLPVTIPRPLRAASWLRMAEIRRIRNGVLNLVVPRRIGACSIISDIDEGTFLAALERLDLWSRRHERQSMRW